MRTPPPPAPPVIGASPARPHRRTPLLFLLMTLLGIGLLGVLAQVEPSGQAFFPRCWFHEMTGLQCPGCGATRAVHALLNGQFERAFRLNGLLILMLPVGFWLAIRGIRGWWTGRWWWDPFTHPTGLAILTGLTLGFGLARNLP